MKLLKYWRLYLPLTYPNIIWRKFDKRAKTMLDVGCCKGSLMTFLNKDKRFEVTGIDVYKPYLAEAKETRIYKKLVFGDARRTYFKSNSFDIVLCSQVIEHLEKEEGEKLIDVLEKVAKTQVIIATTVGFFPYEPFEGKDENPFLVHRSGWRPQEFRSKGYKVYGQSAGFIYGEKGAVRFLPKFLHPLVFCLSYILSPVFYFYPKLAANMICVKNLRE